MTQIMDPLLNCACCLGHSTQMDALFGNVHEGLDFQFFFYFKGFEIKRDRRRGSRSLI